MGPRGQPAAANTGSETRCPAASGMDMLCFFRKSNVWAVVAKRESTGVRDSVEGMFICYRLVMAPGCS